MTNWKLLMLGAVSSTTNHRGMKWSQQVIHVLIHSFICQLVNYSIKIVNALSLWPTPHSFSMTISINHFLISYYMSCMMLVPVMSGWTRQQMSQPVRVFDNNREAKHRQSAQWSVKVGLQQECVEGYGNKEQGVWLRLGVTEELPEDENFKPSPKPGVSPAKGRLVSQYHYWGPCWALDTKRREEKSSLPQQSS